MAKNKAVSWVTTRHGYRVKVWINRRTGTVLPTNWKIQAGMLAEPAQGRKRR